MKKLIAGMLAGFVVNLGLGFAAPSIDRNRFFWNQLNGSAKPAISMATVTRCKSFG